jgi:hypothetical protein
MSYYKLTNDMITSFSGHLMVNTVLEGTLSDIGSGSDAGTLYPKVLIETNDIEQKKQTTVYNYRIYTTDLVREDLGSLEVSDRCFEISKDLFTWLKAGLFSDCPISDEYRVTQEEVTHVKGNITWTDDEVEGWYFDVSLKAPYKSEQCALPTKGC